MPGADGRRAAGTAETSASGWSGTWTACRSAAAYDACDQPASRVSSLSLVRYRTSGAGGLRTLGRW